MASQLKYPGTVTEGTGGLSWTNRDNIKTDNNTGASIVLSTYSDFNTSFGSTFETGNVLTASNFDFSIPSGATINGITLKVKARADTSSNVTGYDPFGDVELQMAVGATNKGNAQLTGFTEDAGYITFTFGGATNMLGSSLTSTDFNDSNFAVKIFTILTAYYDYQADPEFYYGSDISADIDFVSVEVHYTNPIILTTEQGSFAVTGQAAEVLRQFTLIAEPQSYASTGIATTLRYSRIVPLDAGSYLLTGIDASLVRTRLYSVLTGSYSLSGIGADFNVNRRIFSDTGSFNVVGQDIDTRLALRLNAEQGTYTVNYLDAGVLRGRTITAVSASYLSAGLPIALFAPVTLSADQFLFTTFNAFFLNAATGSYAVTGVETPMLRSRVIGADVNHFSVTGVNVFTLYGRTLMADTTAYVWAGSSALLAFNRRFNVIKGEFAVTSATAELNLGFSISVESGGFVVDAPGVILKRPSSNGNLIVFFL
jgi:hypothetical protein